MVVVTGAGIEVCCEVVVVLWVGVDPQADSDTRAATTRDGRRSFFTSIVFVLSAASMTPP